ncbi:hypothetical protein [Planktotalea sp.]|uniref:hypothetical protein n=1 Tax=Planktotalea sp. TaxID=2029877 RepID=UPI003F6D82DF
MKFFSKIEILFESFKPKFFGKSALAVLLAASTFVLPSSASAKMIRVEAIGEITQVNSFASSQFRRGELGIMILTYDTAAIDTDLSSQSGKYAIGALKFFQILDKTYRPHFEFERSANGTITLRDLLVAGDSFKVESLSGLGRAGDLDDGFVAPERAGLKIAGATFELHESVRSVLKSDKLPVTLGAIPDDWSTSQPPSFALQYCFSCGTGVLVNVTFTIKEARVYELTEPILSFELVGQELVAKGEIDATALDAFKKAQRRNPSVKKLVLKFVPGSGDDDANLILSSRVRGSQFATHVPSDGLIASGGVDLFLAGIKRSFDAGACVGVHSWEGGGVEGRDLPKSSPEHDKYLEYFRKLGIQEDFYWFTLEKAAANDMYYMTQAEVDKYGVSTEPAPVMGTQKECIYR